jgi:hypothetical protein
MATNTTIPAHIHHGTLRSLPSHLQEAVLPYRGIRVGFTGTRRLHGGTLRTTEIHAVHRQVQDWVDERKKDGGPITWVQGGCVGFDALAATIVYHTTKRAPVTNHIHTVLPADLKQVDESWPVWSDTYEYLPEGTAAGPRLGASRPPRRLQPSSQTANTGGAAPSTLCGRALPGRGLAAQRHLGDRALRAAHVGTGGQHPHLHIRHSPEWATTTRPAPKEVGTSSDQKVRQEGGEEHE